MNCITNVFIMKNLYLTILLLISCVAFSMSSTFPLLNNKKATNIYVSETEDKVVHTAIEMFCSDMKDVSGLSPNLVDGIVDNSIVISTIGRNEYVNNLIGTKQLSADKIRNQWEAFQIQIIKNGDKKQLIVLGSDSRGTAYGVLQLSRLIGVSPWKWWADAIPDKKDAINISDEYFLCQQPSVQYRGIFLNDEDWGLMPWSSQNFEQSSVKGQIGRKTYEKIFELLLRLRANTLWPAMHESTVPFYFVEGNNEMADKYGIVIGTSHCEPLMRNSAGEWDAKKYGDYNYLTNKTTVCNYWSERLEEAGTYENFYTIGMRGVHDGKMEGVKTLDEQTSVLSQVIKDQRELLTKYVNKDITKIPQSFVPYKEVLSIYENGLKVPEDITLTWCDDNYGYITRLSNEGEQKRSGGSGVYYHISYWGRPHDYLWLSTTQPARIYWQMKKAWDTRARKLWILNVGDIKPAEYTTEFFLDMAWNIDKINPQNIYANLQDWLAREFGEDLAREISPLLNEYYRLANIRKPEFMGWSRVEEYSAEVKNGRTPVIDTEFNPYAFGDEIYNRLSDYSTISEEALRLEKRVPQNKKAAYFQLVQYPICASAEMNKKLLYAQKARLYASYNLPVANEYAEKSVNAYNAIAGLTYTYNHDLMNGKWNGIMDMKPRDLNVYQKAELPDRIEFKNTEQPLIWVENADKPIDNQYTIEIVPFVNPSGRETFISVFQQGTKPIIWSVNQKPEWLNVYEENLNLFTEKRIVFSADWSKVKLEKAIGECVLDINGQDYTFKLEINNLNTDMATEYNKMVIINTSDSGKETQGLSELIEGLGNSTQAVSLSKGRRNALTYRILTTSSGDAIIRTCLLPNHPVNGNDIRYAISVDNEKPQIVSFKTEFRSEDWKKNVLRNQSVNVTYHKLNKVGEHTITIYALDDGVILDQIMLDFEADRKFYTIPLSNNI